MITRVIEALIDAARHSDDRQARALFRSRNGRLMAGIARKLHAISKESRQPKC
jgi:hypothetical protein